MLKNHVVATAALSVFMSATTLCDFTQVHKQSHDPHHWNKYNSIRYQCQKAEINSRLNLRIPPTVL